MTFASMQNRASGITNVAQLHFDSLCGLRIHFPGRAIVDLIVTSADPEAAGLGILALIAASESDAQAKNNYEGLAEFVENKLKEKSPGD